MINFLKKKTAIFFEFWAFLGRISGRAFGLFSGRTSGFCRAGLRASTPGSKPSPLDSGPGLNFFRAWAGLRAPGGLRASGLLESPKFIQLQYQILLLYFYRSWNRTLLVQSSIGTKSFFCSFLLAFDLLSPLHFRTSLIIFF